MCPAQYEHIFSQAAAQLSEEEWVALFDFAFPQSRRLRAFHVWRLSRPCGTAPIDFEGRNLSVSSSSMGMSSSCSVRSPLTPLNQSFGTSQASSYNDLLSRAVVALESCGTRTALAIFDTYLPERYALLRDLLPALHGELREEGASAEDGDWVVLDDQSSCGGDIAQEQSPCQAMYAMASTVLELVHHAVVNPTAPTPLRVYAPAAFQRLRRQHLCHADSLLLPLHSLCTSSRGGAIIFRTADRRLILKEVAEVECARLAEMAEQYVAHVLAHPSTLLCLIFGCFGYEVDGRYRYFMLAENSYPPDEQVGVVYDLKGSSGNRSVLGRAGPRRCSNRLHRRSQQMCVDPLLALKDNDLQCPLELPNEECRQELKAQLHADSHFLMQRGVFDYSLLVAVSRLECGPAEEHGSFEEELKLRRLSDGRVLRLKIVDFLTPWHVSVRVGGVALLQLPTLRSLGYLVTHRLIPEASTMPPGLYQERFVRRVMEKFGVPGSAC